MAAVDSWLKTQSKEIQDKYKASASSVSKPSQPSGTYNPDGSFTPAGGSSNNSTSGGSAGGSSSSREPERYSYERYKAPSYNPISYGEAQSRAQGQIDPIYTRALENVRASIHPAKLDADQVAANRGGLHSGLAADLQNKVQINANNKMADLQGEQASKIAALAQAIMNDDRSQQNTIQQQALQQWMAQNNLIGQMNEFNYRADQDNRLMDYNLWNSWNTQNPAGVTAYHDFINYLRNGR